MTTTSTTFDLPATATDGDIRDAIIARMTARPGAVYAVAEMSNAPEFWDIAPIRIDRSMRQLVTDGVYAETWHAGYWAIMAR